MTDQPSNTNSNANELGALRTKIDRICLRVRLVLVTRGILITIASLLATILALALIDYMLRLPMGIRLINLIGLALLVSKFWLRWIRPTLRLKLSRTDIALQIEELDPSLRGLVAIGIDLESQTHNPNADTDTTSTALTQAAADVVARRLSNQTLPTLVSFGELGKAIVLFVLVCVCIVSLSVRSSNLAEIGITRTLTPWSQTSWPKRFAIIDTTLSKTHPIDIAVPIRASIGSDHSQGSTNARAVVQWRVLDETDRPINPWTSSMLVAQQRRGIDGRLVYEQLIDAQGISSGISDAAFTLEYKITTRDDRTTTKQITLVRPPELIRTSVEIVLPEYAHSIAQSDLVRSGDIAISEYDSMVSPVLAHSVVTIRWEFSKPIELAKTIPGWVSAIKDHNTVVRFEQPTPKTIELEFIADTSLSIEPGIRDTMGIPVRKPIVLSLGVLSDLNPGVAIVEPSRDEVVSAHAVIEINAELSDDFGLSSGVIYATRAHSPSGSSGAPPEPISPRVALVERQIGSVTRATISYTLDLSTLDAEPNDEIWILGVARDLRASTDSESIGVSESTTRVLRVLDERELIDQIRSGLTPIAHALRQLDEQQANLQDQLRDGTLSTSRDQRSIVTRLEANARTIEQLQHQIQRNALDDPALESLLSDAKLILDEASEAGERASDQIDRGEAHKASKNQRTVRDRIGELVSMLDRGQDSWLALRSVEQLRDELKAIREDTAELSKALAGKSLDQLSPEQRSELEQIMERQLESSNDAREMLSTLDERSEQLEEHDPTQAEALRKAASQGRGAQIEQKLKEASEQIGSNQTSSATQTQSDVIEELDEMLEELENTIKNRDNALRRELASIIDSLKALIQAQENEIELVHTPEADTRLIALAGNTLAIRDEALGAFPETRSIADLITQSANAQNYAISALRRSPPSFDEAIRHERSSVLHLKSALEEANRLDEQAAQRQAQQLRTELRDAYRRTLKTQGAVRDETISLGNEPLKRRQRADARALSATQNTLREELSEMLAKTQELLDAPVFTLAHRQLDRLMSTSEDGLAQRTIEPRVTRSQNASISILSTLVEVLSDSQGDQEPEDFDDGSQSGSGSGSGSADEPVIPPLAQLKLLRSMQQLAAMQTREFAENPTLVSDGDIEALSQLQSELFEHGRKLIESMNDTPKPTETSPQTPIETQTEPQTETQEDSE